MSDTLIKKQGGPVQWQSIESFLTENCRMKFSALKKRPKTTRFICVPAPGDGAETLHWSNPGDYDYDENDFEDPDYEIIEEDD